MAGNTIRRNDPCACGSGIKYKKCCGQAPSVGQSSVSAESTVELALHDNPLEHLWTFGGITVIRGLRTDDLLRDASLTEESIIRTLREVQAEISDAHWSRENASNIYFDYDDDLAEHRMAKSKSYDTFEQRLRLPGESVSKGFVETITPIEISGVLLGRLLVIYPKLIQIVVANGNRMDVLHTLCHEFAHAFGVDWRDNPAFDLRCKPYFDYLADYFSLRANMIQGALPETPDLYRDCQYLSMEFVKRYRHQPRSNEELREFANSFLTEVGVLPCPKELLPTSSRPERKDL